MGATNKAGAKVLAINEGLLFDCLMELYSEHEQDCCESHSLCFEDLNIEDFDGLEFDLTNDGFFERVDGYGIRLIATNGEKISIAGHSSNNGYYSSNLTLVLMDTTTRIYTMYDITDCQNEYQCDW